MKPQPGGGRGHFNACGFYLGQGGGKRCFKAENPVFYKFKYPHRGLAGKRGAVPLHRQGRTVKEAEEEREGQADGSGEGGTDGRMENPGISGLGVPLQPPRTPFSLATGEISPWKEISSPLQIKTIRPTCVGPAGPGTTGAGTRGPPRAVVPGRGRAELMEPREATCAGGTSPPRAWGDAASCILRTPGRLGTRF